MQLYYSTNIENQKIILDEVESRHCVKVLRKNLGDKLFVTDGKGRLFETKINEIQKKNVIALIEKTTESTKNPFRYCHIAISPTKNIDRFEWFLEKATEIGVGRITPIICENSERKNIRFDRLEKILISAMKQSLKTFKPILDDLIPYKKFISNQNIFNNKFIAHCQDEDTPHFFKAYQELEEVCILIGPEGDFSPEEISHAKKERFVEVSLGKSRLRTETAGVAACHLVVTKNTLTENLPG